MPAFCLIVGFNAQKLNIDWCWFIFEPVVVTTVSGVFKHMWKTQLYWTEEKISCIIGKRLFVFWLCMRPHCPETVILFVVMIEHFCFIFVDYVPWWIPIMTIYKLWQYYDVNTVTKWDLFFCTVPAIICKCVFHMGVHTTRGCCCTTFDVQALINEDDLLYIIYINSQYYWHSLHWYISMSLEIL